jgi:2-polyprenyl-3-methyl-5-hydroxy-6-metoxy-1,4-benzoquinol methylase
MLTLRARQEIEHGEKLAASDALAWWGWASPAGQMRARRRGALIAASAGLTAGVRGLEIGCGTGLFTEMFADRGADIVAVDISAALLAEARRRCLPAERVTFLEMPFEDCLLHGPFDCVIGSSILHHLDLHTSLTKIFQLLRPGGVMSFAEPNMLNPQIMLQKNVPWIKERLGDSPEETAFFRWSLARQLARHGFEDIRITPFDWLHPSTPESLIPLVRRLGTVLEVLPLIREFAGSLCIRARRP